MLAYFTSDRSSNSNPDISNETKYEEIYIPSANS